MDHTHHDHGPDRHGTRHYEKPPAAALQEIDPVCGMNVDPQLAAGSLEHAGKTHYFCSKQCLEKFKADPAKYVKKSAAVAAPVAASKGAQYTCPMHPEIVRDGPGSCPLCGMALVPIAGTGAANDSELRDLTRRFWVGVVLSVPLVILAMAPMFGIDEPFGLIPRQRGWIEFALGTPVVLWVGWPILHKFWLSLTHRSLNMYTLIGLGVALAYLFSLAAVFAPEFFPADFREHDGAVGTYFEAAAVIVTLVMLGDVLQLRAMGRTSRAIQPGIIRE